MFLLQSNRCASLFPLLCSWLFFSFPVSVLTPPLSYPSSLSIVAIPPICQLPLPLPPPPPPISAVASGSALHPALVPPPPVSAVASGSALGPALVPAPLTFHELAARYAALPPLWPQRHYNVQNPVSVNYNLLFDTFSYYN